MTKSAHAIHILPLRVYLTVGATLLALTFVTVYVSTFDFGEWNLIVAMLIAAIKALLVAFFFMHLFYDSKVYFSIFVGALMFLAVFITFTMFDTQTRGQVNAEQERPINPTAVIYQNAAGTATGAAEAGKAGAGKADSTKPSMKRDSTAADTTVHSGSTAPAK